MQKIIDEIKKNIRHIIHFSNCHKEICHITVIQVYNKHKKLTFIYKYAIPNYIICSQKKGSYNYNYLI